jgi:pyruvate-ferredoxin/flavodoxin oxidoreductase
MAESMEHQKLAVSTGYWPLYRFHPSPEKAAHPFQLDAKRPTRPVGEFMERESRFGSLRRSDPERASQLLELAQADVDERWRYFEQLAAEERTLAANLAAAGEDETTA